ncbi:MAG: M10 family metallopeptidase C-terminal domain-containing protein [Planctomycetes bacterium]|nr:M10 family metallopeptidase C-terminal domain-containing protein [Planctomycetota bacterium]
MGDGDDVFTSFGNARVGTMTKSAPVRGMDGDDTLTGADRADKFFGGKGADKLIGGGSDDRLFGNQDDDLLRGGAGDDLLAGGLGKDWMSGGAGADVFRFHAVETSERGARADRIADFESGTDLIDLSRIAFDIAFIGKEAFAGSGQAELRYAVGDNGTARVLLDADGDGKTDMRINLLDTPTLHDSDFLL